MPDRFEREIDEILSKIEGFPEDSARRRRAHNSLGHRIGDLQRSLMARIVHLSVNQLMLTAFVLMLVSYLFVRNMFGHVWVYGLTLGLLLFFATFALSFRGGGPGRSSEPYFRGRPRSYYDSRGPTWPARLREWWRRRGNRG